MIQIKNYITLIGCLLLISCNTNQREKENSNSNLSTLDMSNWNCDTLSIEQICMPKEWHAIEQNKIYYFAYLDNDDKQTFFTIARYSILNDNVNAEVYLKEFYRQLVNDSEAELFEGYTLKELKFPDKESYYGEYYTKINDEQYFTYSMVIEYEGYLYDIALKVLRGKGPEYKDVFQNILINFEVNHNTIFNTNDEILEEKIVKLHE